MDYSLYVGHALIDARVTDTACFSHRDQVTTTQFALKQTAAGATQLNATTGQVISVQVAGTTVITVAGALITFAQPFKFAAAQEQTTVGAAGGASALPASPSKYFKFQDSAGTVYVFPGYLAA